MISSAERTFFPVARVVVFKQNFVMSQPKFEGKLDLSFHINRVGLRSF